MNIKSKKIEKKKSVNLRADSLKRQPKLINLYPHSSRKKRVPKSINSEMKK